MQTLNNDFYNKLVVRGSIKNRAEIKRIQQDMKGLREKYGKSTEDIMKSLLNEVLNEGENYE